MCKAMYNVDTQQHFTAKGKTGLGISGSIGIGDNRSVHADVVKPNGVHCMRGTLFTFEPRATFCNNVDIGDLGQQRNAEVYKIFILHGMLFLQSQCAFRIGKALV